MAESDDLTKLPLDNADDNDPSERHLLDEFFSNVSERGIDSRLDSNIRKALIIALISVVIYNSVVDNFLPRVLNTRSPLITKIAQATALFAIVYVILLNR